MSGETLLSDLCSICNTAKSKYRCPGCAARTCSLPCYKRHQQWAQCTGKRDPTKYVKKSQLTTPAGIDHDFNFLTSIERGLEKAEREASGSGLGAASSDVRTVRKVGAGRYAAAGVTVIPAPKGLSRQKENNTHLSNRNHIVWTVEWIHEDKSRSLSETSDWKPLQEAYCEHTNSPLTKKRKRGAPDSSPLEETTVIRHEAQEPKSARVTQEDQKAEPSSSGQPPFPAKSRESDGKSTLKEGPESDNEVADGPPSGPRMDGSDSKPLPTEYHFFLLKPRTSCSQRVLIPLAQSATLKESLTGRTVLDFPTIYVFNRSSPRSSDEFILEEDYLKQESEDQKEFESLMKDIKPETLRAIKREDDDGKGSDEVDSKRILDVLKQDLGGTM